MAVRFGETVEGLCVMTDGPDPSTFQFTVNGVDRTADFTVDATGATASALPLATSATGTFNTLVASVEGYGETGTFTTLTDTAVTTVWPGVQVSPAGGPAALEEQGEGDFRFVVHNNTGATASYTLACATDAAATCLSTVPSSLTLASDIGDTVTVRARVASGSGSATVQLIASGPTSDTASQTVTITPVTRLRVFSPTLDQADRSACPILGAGAGSAVQCGDLLYAHGFPGYVSMGKPRTLTMLYSSGMAQPSPSVTLEYTTLAGEGVPEMLAVEMRDVATDTLLRRAVYATGSIDATQRVTHRMVVALDHPMARQSGARSVQARVFARVAGSWNWNAPVAMVGARLMVVDRATSPFGAGWWPAGVERLHVAQDSGGAMVEFADGSTLFYRRAGSSLVAPPGDHSTLVQRPDGRFERTLEGGRAQLTYDASGLLEQVRDNNPAPNVATYSWTAGRLTSMTDAGGGTVTFAWDTAGVRMAWPGVDSVRLLRNATGDVTAIRDADGFLTTFGYQRGTPRMVESTARGTKPFRYTYGLGGFVDSVVATAEVGVPQHRRSYTAWQRAGLAPVGGATEGAPATLAQGRPLVRVAQERFLSTQNVEDVTGFTIHSTGAVLRASGPGGATEVARDSLGRVVAVTLPNGGRIRQEYDTSGFLLRSIADVEPGLVGRDTLVRHDTTHYTWHPAWRTVTKVVDPMGDSSRVVLDSLGRQQAVIDALGRRTEFHLTARGQPDSIWAPHPTVMGEREPAPVVMVYDSVTGNLLRTGKGANVTHYGYAAGNPRRPVLTANVLGDTTEHAYDLQGRVTQVLQYGAAGGRRRVRYAYDDTLRIRTQFDPNDQRSQWFHDGMGRVVRACVRDNWCDSNEYGDGVNPTVQRDRRGTESWNTFDGAGRVVERRIGFNNQTYGTETQGFAYDALGNLTLAMNANSIVRRTYDGFGRLTSEEQQVRMLGPDSGTMRSVRVLHSHDPNGRRRATHVDGLGSEQRVCTPRPVLDDAPISCQQAYRFIPTDSVRYAYDDAGQLETMVSTMWQLTPGQGTNTWTWEHDRKGRLSARSAPTTNGATRVTYAYDDGDHLRRVLGTPALPFDSTSLDLIGRVIGRHDDNSSRGYAFDALGQLVTATSVAGATEQFTYDSTGNRRTDNSWTYGYDTRGQLEERVATLSQNTGCRMSYLYDHAGNMTRQQWEGSQCDGERRREMTYDAANHMTSMRIEVSSGVITRDFWYDALGRRIFMRTNDERGVNDVESGTWRYYWADDHVIAQTRSDYDSTGGGWNLLSEVGLRREGGELSATGQWFFYGPGMDRPLATLNKVDGLRPSRHLFFQDLQGSSISVTDADGVIMNGSGARFEAFGAGGGAQVGQPGFNGATASAGLVYMRNRWYDPNTGRFTQQDPIGFAGGINLYAYAGNDPVSYSDPYGLSPDSLCNKQGGWKNCDTSQADKDPELQKKLEEARRKAVANTWLTFSVFNGVSALFGGSSAAARGAASGVEATRAAPAAEVTFGHGARHLAGTGLNAGQVEAAITRQVQQSVQGASGVGPFWGRLNMGGHTIEYRAFPLPSGAINVGTYYPLR